MINAYRLSSSRKNLACGNMSEDRLCHGVGNFKGNEKENLNNDNNINQYYESSRFNN
jgi:hypothetical protein